MSGCPYYPFLPNQVSILILGYLKQENYLKTYEAFISECDHLSSIVKQGVSLENYTCLHDGTTLSDIFSEYGQMIRNRKQKKNNYTESLIQSSCQTTLPICNIEENPNLKKINDQSIQLQKNQIDNLQKLDVSFSKNYENITTPISKTTEEIKETESPPSSILTQLFSEDSTCCRTISKRKRAPPARKCINTFETDRVDKFVKTLENIGLPEKLAKKINNEKPTIDNCSINFNSESSFLNSLNECDSNIFDPETANLLDKLLSENNVDEAIKDNNTTKQFKDIVEEKIINSFKECTPSNKNEKHVKPTVITKPRRVQAVKLSSTIPIKKNDKKITKANVQSNKSSVLSATKSDMDQLLNLIHG